MDWKLVKYFNKGSFSENGDYANPRLINALDTGRELIGEKMWPSPVKGALARFGSSRTSQHWVGKEEGGILVRKSTGSDIFAEGNPFNNFLILYQSGLFGGIGIYLDTNGPDGHPWVMFHLDVREVPAGKSPLVWFGIKIHRVTKYKYPTQDLKHLQLFRDVRLFNERVMKW